MKQTIEEMENQLAALDNRISYICSIPVGEVLTKEVKDKQVAELMMKRDSLEKEMQLKKAGPVKSAGQINREKIAQYNKDAFEKEKTRKAKEAADAKLAEKQKELDGETTRCINYLSELVNKHNERVYTDKFLKSLSHYELMSLYSSIVEAKEKEKEYNKPVRSIDEIKENLTDMDLVENTATMKQGFGYDMYFKRINALKFILEYSIKDKDAIEKCKEYISASINSEVDEIEKLESSDAEVILCSRIENETNDDFRLLYEKGLKFVRNKKEKQATMNVSQMPKGAVANQVIIPEKAESLHKYVIYTGETSEDVGLFNNQKYEYVDKTEMNGEIFYKLKHGDNFIFARASDVKDNEIQNNVSETVEQKKEEKKFSEMVVSFNDSSFAKDNNLDVNMKYKVKYYIDEDKYVLDDNGKSLIVPIDDSITIISNPVGDRALAKDDADRMRAAAILQKKYSDDEDDEESENFNQNLEPVENTSDDDQNSDVTNTERVTNITEKVKKLFGINASEQSVDISNDNNAEDAETPVSVSSVSKFLSKSLEGIKKNKKIILGVGGLAVGAWVLLSIGLPSMAVTLGSIYGAYELSKGAKH